MNNQRTVTSVCIITVYNFLSSWESFLCGRLFNRWDYSFVSNRTILFRKYVNKDVSAKARISS
jgi:hypothetical protein